jgi:lysyl-tRNA synthetase class II
MEEQDLFQIRLSKMHELEAMGIDPFGGRFSVTHHAGDILAFGEGKSKDELEVEYRGATDDQAWARQSIFCGSSGPNRHNPDLRQT